MFILRHGTREDKPFLRSVVIGVTGLDISCSEEKKAMRFVSRGAAVVEVSYREAIERFLEDEL